MRVWFIIAAAVGAMACQKASSPAVHEQRPLENQKRPPASKVRSPVSDAGTPATTSGESPPTSIRWLTLSPSEVGPKKITCREMTMRQGRITLTRTKNGEYRFTSPPVAAGPEWPRSVDAMRCLFNRRDWRVFRCYGRRLVLETTFVRSSLGEGYRYTMKSEKAFRADGTWSSCTRTP